LNALHRLRLFVLDDVRPLMHCSAHPAMTNYYNTGVYYYSPLQPMFYVGRPLIPVSQFSSSVASFAHHVSRKLLMYCWNCHDHYYCHLQCHTL